MLHADSGGIWTPTLDVEVFHLWAIGDNGSGQWQCAATLRATLVIEDTGGGALMLDEVATQALLSNYILAKQRDTAGAAAHMPLGDRLERLAIELQHRYVQR
jgi:hypothetical protein